MRYVFFGGKESAFAETILNNLKKSGLAPIAEIRDAKAPLDPEYLKSLDTDFFLVASFAKILKKEIIDIPPKGTVGVHPSLLPRLRGASPIQSALLNDEKETGTTLFLIDEKVDHGPILATNNLQLTTDDNYLSLEKKLAELSAELAIKTLPKWLNGEIKPWIQDESQATYTKKFKAEDAEVKVGPISSAGFMPINPREAWLKIRALNPEPGAFTILPLKNGKVLRLKLLEADYQNGPGRASKLELTKVQPEGKRPMDYKSFLNGYQKLLN